MAAAGADNLHDAGDAEAAGAAETRAGAPPNQPSFAAGLPGYTFLREIGRGGQAAVYLAIQKSTQRRVAIKVMREGPFSTPDERMRFEREVNVLARFHHPNIVTVYDSGEVDGFAYIVMEYVPGESLDAFMRRRTVSLVCEPGKRGRRSVTDVQRAELRARVELFAKIAQAVGAAHEAGIVHRDLKPANIRIDPAGEPHVLDFGLAKMWQQGQPADLAALTQTGQFLGSVPWSSPEQVSGRSALIDARSDVYSLGVVLYQLLTEAFPYDVTGSFPKTSSEILNAAAKRPSVRAPAMPMELEAVILKTLEKAPESRYATCAALADDLSRFLAGESVQARVETLVGRLQRSTQRSARKHPFVALIVAALSAATAADLIPFIPTIWRPLELLSSRILSTAATATTGDLPDVRAVEIIEDSAGLTKLGESIGIAGVNVQQDYTTRRLLITRLLERVAEAGSARIVMLDMGFPTESVYDAAMADAITHVESTGAAVVIGLTKNGIREDDTPIISKRIASVVRWGRLGLDGDVGGQFSVRLAYQHPNGRPVPSFCLTAYSTLKRPGEQFSVDLIDTPPTVHITFGEPISGIQQVWRSGGTSLSVPVALMEHVVQSRGDVRTGDRIGQYFVPVPRYAQARAASWSLTRALTAPISELREWLAAKVLICGDSTNSEDSWAGPEGPFPGWCVHASGIQSLLLNQSIHRVGRESETFPLLAVVATIGGCAARGIRSTALSCVTAGAAVALILAAAVLLARIAQIHMNPFVPIVALLLSFGIVRLLLRDGHSGA